ncbi:F1F0 ATP synthase subunit 4 [Saccharomyces eubayanus]|uniref:F1F0 ATP synthase subunit 4 n=1 Tax=Saccharomyces eubayanus TaxID=1080349 RepID=UPI0006C71E1D|nr:ATP4-like protein [Saccharomyces eubayanus]KOG96235.1 ATP4-like protein [Saccharomyces eubayanus]
MIMSMSVRGLALRSASKSLLNQGIRRSPVVVGARYMSSTPEKQTDPKTKANSIINAIPGNNILTKTGVLGTSAAAVIYAISNELYVVNDESILLLTFLGFTGLVAKYLAPAYKDFADSRMKKVSEILNASRNKHVEAVKDRIGSVSELQNVAETTKVLFDVSKETVELESEAFELRQKVELAHEAKSVLDSWVRYESSLRQLEQRQLTASVIAKVESELGNPKFQDKVLQQSITEIEQLLSKLK